MLREGSNKLPLPASSLVHKNRYESLHLQLTLWVGSATSDYVSEVYYGSAWDVD